MKSFVLGFALIVGLSATIIKPRSETLVRSFLLMQRTQRADNPCLGFEIPADVLKNGVVQGAPGENMESWTKCLSSFAVLIRDHAKACCGEGKQCPTRSMANIACELYNGQEVKNWDEVVPAVTQYLLEKTKIQFADQAEPEVAEESP